MTYALCIVVGALSYGLFGVPGLLIALLTVFCLWGWREKAIYDRERSVDQIDVTTAHRAAFERRVGRRVIEMYKEQERASSPAVASADVQAIVRGTPAHE